CRPLVTRANSAARQASQKATFINYSVFSVAWEQSIGSRHNNAEMHRRARQQQGGHDGVCGEVAAAFKTKADRRRRSAMLLTIPNGHAGFPAGKHDGTQPNLTRPRLPPRSEPPPRRATDRRPAA